MIQKIHEETQKYKFWLYDYTDATQLFGTDFITAPPKPYGGGTTGTGGGEPGGTGTGDNPAVADISGKYVAVVAQGRFILSSIDGRDTPIPVDEYRKAIIQRAMQEAHSLDEFRELWITSKKRRQFIDHLLGDNYSPDLIREADSMTEFDLYDFFGHHGYNARAMKRPQRSSAFIHNNQHWLESIDTDAAIILTNFSQQFAFGGTDTGSLGNT